MRVRDLCEATYVDEVGYISGTSGSDKTSGMSTKTNGRGRGLLK